MTDIAIESLPKVWRTFFKKFEDIDYIKTFLWKEVHLLAYFDRRYFQYYGRKFVYSLTGQPSKCAEIVLIKKINLMLGQGNPVITKEYIDWIFDTKIISNRLKIRTLGFLTTPGLGNEFLEKSGKSSSQKIEKITRSMVLSQDHQNILQSFNLEMETYGDLAFAYLVFCKNPKHPIYSKLFQKLTEENFDFGAFDEI